MNRHRIAALGIAASCGLASAQTAKLPVPGYASTTVNTVVFRGNSVASLGQTQYVAYYEGAGKVVLAKRILGSTAWESRTTSLTGGVTDAHNSISLGVDGDGFLHMAWSMHSSKMRYCRSTSAGSLDMGAEGGMIGTLETSATYPQFFRLQDGNLLFLYRDGSSGNGNLVVNRYDTKSKKWSRVQSNLIDGQGARNAYWEAYLDGNGVLHLGWVWRETADVATNHDLCYARSKDGGVTWEKSDGAKYALPINATTAEVALKIAQNSELINQTSIAADARSRPYIASYWVPSGESVPQYQLAYLDGSTWKSQKISRRTTDFSLSGTGTKKIPISRPQLAVNAGLDSVAAYVVFRDVERGSKVSLAQTSNLAKPAWTVSDLTDSSVDEWEPSFDTDLWNTSHVLDLYVQRAGQGDGETTVNLAPQTVTVLEWKPPQVAARLGDRLGIAEPAGAPSCDILGRRAANEPSGLRRAGQVDLRVPFEGPKRAR